MDSDECQPWIGPRRALDMYLRQLILLLLIIDESMWVFSVEKSKKKLVGGPAVEIPDAPVFKLSHQSSLASDRFRLFGVPATLCLIPDQLTKRAPAPGPIVGSLGNGHEEKHHQHHRHRIMLILGDDVGWLRLLDLGVHAEDAHPPQGAALLN